MVKVGENEKHKVSKKHVKEGGNF